MNGLVDRAFAQLNERRAAWLVSCASVLLALPVLVFRYLPMTDFPQYLAAGSILQHLHDKTFGYEQYYEPALWRTLSWLPYGLLRLLSIALPLEFSLRVIVFVALLLQPLGVYCMLVACGKPRLYALLTFPMVYSSQFFWGVIASNLSLGMALCACGLVMLPARTRRQELGLCVLGIAIAFTHVYGVLVLLVVARVWRRRHPERQRWSWSLWPVTLFALPWLWFASRADPIGSGIHPTLSQRLLLMSDALLGGFEGAQELWLLLALAGAWLLLVWPVLPRTAAAWAAISPNERALWILLLLAGGLYLVLPLNTAASFLINTRVAVLGFTLAPLLLPSAAICQRPRLAISLPLIIALASMLHAYDRLHAFDTEAHDFDAIAAASKPRARVIAFIEDARGKVSASVPYLQFGGYLLAQHGGYLARDYFAGAWSLPVRVKPHLSSGAAPDLLTSPEVSAYDELIVRGPDSRELIGIGGFDHALILQSGAWSLYRPAPPSVPPAPP